MASISISKKKTYRIQIKNHFIAFIHNPIQKSLLLAQECFQILIMFGIVVLLNKNGIIPILQFIGWSKEAGKFINRI
jgi:hypothetical protein